MPGGVRHDLLHASKDDVAALRIVDARRVLRVEVYARPGDVRDERLQRLGQIDVGGRMFVRDDRADLAEQLTGEPLRLLYLAIRIALGSYQRRLEIQRQRGEVMSD